MNTVQKIILISAALGILIALLIPPHAFFYGSSDAKDMGYAFITEVPSSHAIYLTVLLAELFGIVFIGGIFYFMAEDK